MNSQLSIFDIIYPKFKIDKPIRLIELFAGYGSQALALKYLGVPFEHWKICEWAIKSIQAYKDIHFTDDNKDYSQEQYSNNLALLKNTLFELGISNNYNEPMSKEQINRLNEKQLRNIYNNIVATHNLVNIQQAKGENLEITDTDKYCYIMCYSFPCQDLSLAGKGKGMSDTSTRSGMLWEVERILTECKELGTLPQILLMENVPQVHGEGNTEDFNKWQLRLEELGYKNYWEDLIATDYGIPQTRNRCFMVSILGDYSYSFPPKQELKIRLKDMLEDNVDEKYYLSDAMLKYMYSESSGGISRKEMFERNFKDGDIRETAATITTNNVQKGMIQTLDTQCDRGVVVKPKVLGGIGEKDSNNGTQWKQQNRIYDDNVSISVTTSFNPYYKNELRIRKLTPYECFALMGVKKEDYFKCAKHQSDSSLYHLAGDSIVVNVLMAIFKEML